jgi:hypothetical protein
MSDMTPEMEDMTPEEWMEAIGKAGLTSRPVRCPLCGGPATSFHHGPADVPSNFFTWVQVCDGHCADGKPMFVTAAHVFPHE